MAAWGRQLAFAFRFYTRLPIGFKIRLSPGDIAKSPRWFWLVGFFEGGLLALALVGASRIVDDPYFLAGICALLRGLVAGGQISGMAHAMDGLNSSRDRVVVVEVMLDRHLGVCGAAAVISDLLLRFVLYLQLFSYMSTSSALPILICSCIAGKLAVCTALGTSGSVFKRDRLIDDSGKGGMFLSATALALAAYRMLGLETMGLSLVLEIALGLIVSGVLVLRIGGLTKQMVQLIHEIGEIMFIYTLLIW